MEKYGIEKENKEDNVKEGEEKCAHPEEFLKKDGNTVFCTKCGKYIGVQKD